jgi:hypothetical protein
MYVNKVVRRKFSPKRNEIKEGQGKLYDEELHQILLR